MKRILSIVLAVAVLATLCLTLASCGKLSGTYENKGMFTTTSLTFKGDTVTIEMGSVKAEGTYEIKDEKITIEIENDGKLGLDDLLKGFNGEHDFEKGKDYIKIGSTKYTKADK
ncbi:MAG: hypothetical protein IJA86_02745 [Clostridia bacterium]|nr:hypothetical protein [Clostridia bacterium]